LLGTEKRAFSVVESFFICEVADKLCLYVIMFVGVQLGKVHIKLIVVF